MGEILSAIYIEGRILTPEALAAHEAEMRAFKERLQIKLDELGIQTKLGVMGE